MNSHRPSALRIGVLLLIVGLSGPSYAQLPSHRIDGVFPAGGRPGETLDVVVTGGDLETADGLWFDHPGFAATLVEPGKFKLVIGPEAPLGCHDLRVTGPLGISNPRIFVVDRHPRALEIEPNNVAAQAQQVATRAVIDGRIDPPTDVDWFAIDARAGERIVVSVEASAVESRLDPILRLRDPSGRELAVSPDPDGDGADADPRIELTAKEDGRYTIELSDVVYAGSPQHVYRMVVGEAARVDTVRPLAAAPGETVDLTLFGRRLDAWSAERLVVQVAVPVDLDADPSRIDVGPLLSQRSGLAGFAYRHESPSGATKPVFIGRSLGKVGVEVEPNDEANVAHVVSAPCDISGAFADRGDRDLYRISAKKGEEWMVEAIADRQGSAADPLLQVVRLDKDGQEGAEVARGDDSPDREVGGLFSQATTDPIVRWKVAEDGDYLIVVQDLYASQRGSERLSYRLVVRAVEPDFRLFVVPYAEARPEGLTLRAGGREAVRVLVDRLDGFDRPVLVEAVDLPAGVRAASIVVAGKQARSALILEADDGVAPTIATLKVIGRSLSEDRREHLATLERAPRLGSESTRAAIPGHLVAQAPQGDQPALARAARGFPFAIRPGSPMRLSAGPAEVTVAPGQAFELKVAVERRTGFESPVEVGVDALPRNLAGASVTIPKDQAEAALRIDVPSNVAPGVYSIHLRGAGTYPFHADPKAEKKNDVRLSEPSNPIRLIVRKP